VNLHTVRSAGFSGLAFVVLVIVSVLLPGIPPDNSAPTADVGHYFDAHRTMVLIAAWLSIPSTALFAWYAVGLYRLLTAAGNDEGLPLFALVNGIIAGAVALVTAVLQISLTFHPSSQIGEPAIRVLYDAYSVSGALTLGATAFMMFGFAASGMRHGSLPRWLCQLTYLFAIGNLAASVTAMYNSGFMALGGMGSLVVGVIPFVLWLILTSVVMIGKGAAAAR
jgi:hypothetical protein